MCFHMVGNSLVQILTSNSDQGFTITASSEYSTGRAKYMAFDNNTSTRWRSLGESAAWLQLQFPKSAKITGININSGSGGVACSFKTLVSKDGITFTNIHNDYISVSPAVFTFELASPIISKFIKFQGNDAEWNTILEAQIYGFYSPGKFLMKTHNNYIYNGNIVNKDSTSLENISNNNTLAEFIEDCNNALATIVASFSVIKIVK